MKTVPLFRQITSEYYDAWNSFVDSSPQGDVFSYSWWLDAITKGNFKILAVFENNEIVAGIPLAYYIGKINEPPLTRTLGPLYKDLSHLSEHDRITTQRVWLNLLLDHIPLDEFEQFCTSHNFNDWLPFRWRGLKQMTRYTYLLDVNGVSEEVLWNKLNTNRKRLIKRAFANNLKTRITEDLRDFYTLIELTYERQGLKFRFSFDDFKLLDDEIVKREQRIILTAFDEQGNPHAAIYLAFNKKSAYALLSASDPKYRQLGGHTLVVWDAIRYFRNKVNHYNFGGSDIQRIENHIRGFGGEIKQYFHIYTEKPVVKEIEKIVEKEVIREVPVMPPPPPDTLKYHLNIIFRHSWHLVKKVLFKAGIHPPVPVRVSVITSCFNHGKFIHEMLDSVLAQTFQNFEVIIVNDGSNDDTSEILDRLKNKKVRVFHTSNHGPAHARNLAITHASGDLIVNLDADNRIAPDYVKQCVEVMDLQPNVGIVYSDLMYFGAKNEPFVIPEYSFENMLQWNCIDGNACFRKSDWERTRGYSNEMQHGYEDFDFWLSILELGREVFKINAPLVYYRSYYNEEESRSGKRRKNPEWMEEVVIHAFRNHLDFYKKSPNIYADFVKREQQFAENLGEKVLRHSNPVFSIITPTNKRPELLKRNIESIRQQSFTDWEQVIVDDANDPETRDMVIRINDPRIRYIAHETLKGAAGAYNTGMKNSRGQYINFLDDDDEYLPGILEKIKRTFDEATNNPGFVWTGITRVKDTDHGEEIIRTQVWPADFESFEQGLMVSTAIGNGFGLSIKRECLKKSGLYDESLKVSEDTDFMLRLSQYYSFRTVPEVLVKIHHHSQDQLTHDKYSRAKWSGYGKIIDRHYDFLSKHWDSLYMHYKVYVNLCYQLNERRTGRRALWRLAKTFPNRRLVWLDLICYSFWQNSYQDCAINQKIKAVKTNIRAAKTQFFNLPKKIRLLQRWYRIRTEYPKNLTIFLTSRCNLECFFCNRETSTNRDVKFENLHKLKKAIKNAETINLTSDGEALLYKQYFDVLDMIFKLNKKKELIRFATNGTLLTEKLAKALTGRINNIRISLNAASEETYNREIKFGNFNKTIQSITRFLNELDAADRKKVDLHLVAYNHNFSEMPDFVRIAHSLGISCVTIGHYFIYRDYQIKNSIYFHQDEYNKAIEKAEKIAGELGINFYARTFIENAEINGKCLQIQDDCYIDVDGNAFVCCQLTSETEKAVGNVYQSGFKKVWFGKKYIQIRKSGKLPDCETCPRIIPLSNSKAHTHLKGL